MGQNTLIIFDTDSHYAVRLQQFMCNVKENHFKVYAFTNRADLLDVYGDIGDIRPEILLVAESSFCEELVDIKAKHIFILNETGMKRYPEYVNINKYQPANALFQQILLEYAGREKDMIPRFYGNKMAKLVGVYTPVKRCMQTSFSIALAQMLGKKGKTIYINFEQYSGFSQLFQKGYLKDLSDLVYFFEYSRDKFLYWLEGVVEHFGNMDYIPPVLTAASLMDVSGKVWTELFEMICKEAGYDYVVLDLSDSVRGIYQILDMCHIVYSITRDDVISKAKLHQFGQILDKPEYTELKEKVNYLRFPEFTIKNNVFENIIYKDLYDYVENLLGDFNE